MKYGVADYGLLVWYGNDYPTKNSEALKVMETLTVIKDQNK